MRSGMTPEVMTALGADEIITALMVRLEFQTETMFVWTGSHPIIPSGSGDSAMDGNQFEPLINGVIVDIGENAFSYSGSDAFEMAVALPSSPSLAISNAEVFPSEFQGRTAIVWRAIRLPSGDPLAPPVWFFKRIRTGAMDTVETTNDGSSHTFKLTIESHQARISQATQQTYLDQKRYDPADTSQDYAPALANGDPAPSKSSGVISGGLGGMYDAASGGRLSNNVQLY